MCCDRCLFDESLGNREQKQQITASMYNTGVRAVTHKRSSEEAILGGSVSCKSRLGMETISVHTIECDD